MRFRSGSSLVLALGSLLLGAAVFACSSDDAASSAGGAGANDAGGTTTGDAGSGTSADDGGSAADAGDAAASYPVCGPDPLPTPCEASATTVPATGDYGAEGSATVKVTTLDNPHPTAPGKISVYFPTGTGKPPVLFFSHAYGATDPASYDGLLRHLASRGYVAVHVPYRRNPGPGVEVSNADSYDCLWEGFNQVVTTYGAVLDLTHVGFLGHSFGGGATPEMARRGFVEKGWGSAGRFMFIMAPWYSWGSGYDTIPTDVRTVVQVYADDAANDHQIAVSDVWNKLPAGMEKSWMLIHSDICEGVCGLDAPHILPMTGQSATKNAAAILNGNDVWGIFRRVDALAAYAFDKTAAARDVAYGLDTAMGTFTACGGRAVRPLESSLTTPITTTCLAQVYPLAKRCENADPGYPCP